MRGWKQTGLLFWLLSKRLYKKASFLMLLVFLIAITAVVSVLMRQESRMLRIALVEDHSSQEVARMVKALDDSSAVVDYRVVSEADANKQLETGKIDAVWQFADDFDTSLSAYIADQTNPAPIQVRVREKTVFLGLAMERLYAELYPVISREFYTDYAVQEMDLAPDATLQQYYEAIDRERTIIEVRYHDFDGGVEDAAYLVAPLRGLLAILLALGSMASSLYFLHDCENGHMEAIPLRKRWSRQWWYAFSGTVNMALFVLLALLASGLMTNGWAEWLAILLYVVASAGFSMVVSGLCGKTARMASVLPLLTLMMLVICPVFLNIQIPYLSWLFPAYWYLAGVYSPIMLLGLAGCGVVMIGLSYLLWYSIRERNPQA